MKRKAPAKSNRAGSPPPEVERGRYFLLVPKDQPHNNWVLYTDDPKTGVKLRSRYADLRCANCGKVDEDAAIAAGIDPDVRVRAKADYLSTDDGFICLSRRAVDVVTESGVLGFRFVPLPGDPDYQVAMPDVLARTDAANANVEIRGPEDCDPLVALGLGHMSDFPRKARKDRRCARCKRFFTTLFLPALASMELPNDPMAVFASDLWSENCKGLNTWFHASGVVASILKKAKLTGIEYNDPY